MSRNDSSKRWAGNLLRDAALHAAEDASYWDTAPGLALLGQLDRFVSPHVARQVRSSLRYAVEAAEVTNTIVVQMTSQPSFVAGLRGSMNPWGYLAECARRWSRAQAGHRMLELDGLIGIEPASSGVEEIFDPESGLTPVADVIASTIQALRGYTDAVEVQGLDQVVEWFALNPPQHQGHGHSDARRAPELRALGFTPAQISALANVTWGGRPNQKATSLFYGFLLDSGFVPETSRTHRIALTALRRTFSRGELTGEK